MSILCNTYGRFLIALFLTAALYGKPVYATLQHLLIQSSATLVSASLMEQQDADHAEDGDEESEGGTGIKDGKKNCPDIEPLPCSDAHANTLDTGRPDAHGRYCPSLSTRFQRVPTQPPLLTVD